MKNIQLKIPKFCPVFRGTISLLVILLYLLHTTNIVALPLERIELPPEFEINVYATNVPGARSMTLSPNGTLFVGTRAPGKVYAVLDHDKDTIADEVITIAEGLNSPNGVALRGDDLYVAEISRVLRYENIESDLNNPPAPVVVNADFPTDRAHGWKFIRFGPDGLLYVPVGAPCNVCDRDKQDYSTIRRMSPDGTGLQVYARGVRNTVGFDWHPETKALWFTDNGRDHMGDNRPPDELNFAPNPGMHFGFPHCHGTDILDPVYGRGRDCKEFTPPAIELGPHVAALGMRFYTGPMFGDEYRNQIFIAEHGSWNRSIPIGYRVTLVRVEGNKAVSYEVFAKGWLNADGNAWGRPVDVLVMPDGALLVSDDRANAIYRISRAVKPPEKEEKEPVPLPAVNHNALFPNYPNPTKLDTWIPYQLVKNADVRLRIYDVSGHLVRDLSPGQQSAGVYRNRSEAAYWDGRNSSGELVGAGIYFYTLETNEFRATRQMSVVR